MEQPGDHAVVLGASVAGLLAARVLADFYGRVTVVERDSLPLDPVNRRGVPQGRLIHALAARGTQVLDELFPGFLSPKSKAVSRRVFNPSTAGLKLTARKRREVRCRTTTSR